MICPFIRSSSKIILVHLFHTRLLWFFGCWNCAQEWWFKTSGRSGTNFLIGDVEMKGGFWNTFFVHVFTQGPHRKWFSLGFKKKEMKLWFRKKTTKLGFSEKVTKLGFRVWHGGNSICLVLRRGNFVVWF
jgi:hypothetical protein